MSIARAIVILMCCGVAVEVQAQARDWSRDAALLEDCSGDAAVPAPSTATLLARGQLTAVICRDNVERDPSDVDISRLSAKLSAGLLPRMQVHVGFAAWTRIDVDGRLPAVRAHVGWSGFGASWASGVGALLPGAKMSLFSGDRSWVAFQVGAHVPLGSHVSAGEFALSGELLGSRVIGNALLDASLGLAGDADLRATRIAGRLSVSTTERLVWSLSATSAVIHRQTAYVELAVAPTYLVSESLFIRPVFSVWLGDQRRNFDYRGTIGFTGSRGPMFFPPIWRE